jgi:carbon monoxide dehydrogenase subunit G
MVVCRTTFGIAASSEVVWAVLTDFERYSEWNPSLPSIVGDLRVAARCR